MVHFWWSFDLPVHGYLWNILFQGFPLSFCQVITCLAKTEMVKWIFVLYYYWRLLDDCQGVEGWGGGGVKPGLEPPPVIPWQLQWSNGWTFVTDALSNKSAASITWYPATLCFVLLSRMFWHEVSYMCMCTTVRFHGTICMTPCP